MKILMDEKDDIPQEMIDELYIKTGYAVQDTSALISLVIPDRTPKEIRQHRVAVLKDWSITLVMLILQAISLTLMLMWFAWVLNTI